MDIHLPLNLLQSASKSGSSSPETISLRDGDQLRALVLEVEKGQDALLSFGRFKAYARMPVPVVSGQEVDIQVQAHGEELRLLLESGPSGKWAGAERPAIRLFEPVPESPLLADQASALKAGTTLEGRITGFEKDGLKLVDFGAFKAFAKIDFPVRQGQVIPLAVVQSGKELSLVPAGRQVLPEGFKGQGPSSGPTPEKGAALPTPAMIAESRPPQVAPKAPAPMDPSVAAKTTPPPTTAEVAALRSHISQLLKYTNTNATGRSSDFAKLSAPIEKALQNLQQVLTPAMPGGNMQTLVARVRAFVEHSGIYFEKRLGQEISALQSRSAPMSSSELAEHPRIRDLMDKDMKPNLLILREFLDAQRMDGQGADRHLLETLKSVVQRTVAHIEQQQVGATEKPLDTDILQAFSHLLFLTDEKNNARLNVYFTRKGRDGEHKKPRVSLLLDMDRLGMVRTDLWMAGKDLNITFFVADDAVQELIRKEHPRIIEPLQTIFNTVAVNVVVSEKKIAAFDGEDLALPNQRQLDVSV
jgi:hypothetical protein